MHLLAAQPGAIADGSEAVDLGQSPGDIVVLSAADSELACLAGALDAFDDIESQFSTDLANLVLEQISQRLDELEAHPFRQATHIVMGLDRVRRPAH